ncbi:hypothetical protein VTJ04DRAFT_2491 [Mycothermus thermophilus]|uniref:uncharacterized protein n=1 Tax=Humicola insolens TaxID=85995 RepID=UPI003742BA0C
MGTKSIVALSPRASRMHPSKSQPSVQTAEFPPFPTITCNLHPNLLSSHQHTHLLTAPHLSTSCGIPTLPSFQGFSPQFLCILRASHRFCSRSNPPLHQSQLISPLAPRPECPRKSKGGGPAFAAACLFHLRLSQTSFLAHLHIDNATRRESIGILASPLASI